MVFGTFEWTKVVFLCKGRTWNNSVKNRARKQTFWFYQLFEMPLMIIIIYLVVDYCMKTIFFLKKLNKFKFIGYYGCK